MQKSQMVLFFLGILGLSACGTSTGILDVLSHPESTQVQTTSTPIVVAPQTTTIKGKVNAVATGSFGLSNKGSSDLLFMLRKKDPSNLVFQYAVSTPKSGTSMRILKPGLTDMIQVSENCPNRQGIKKYLVEIIHTDPSQQSPLLLEVIRACEVGPVPQIEWVPGSGFPANAGALYNWAFQACGVSYFPGVINSLPLAINSINTYKYQFGLLYSQSNGGYGTQQSLQGYYGTAQQSSAQPMPDPYKAQAEQYWNAFVEKCKTDHQGFVVVFKPTW